MVFSNCSDTQLRRFCFSCVSAAKKLLGGALYLGVSENDTALCELSSALKQAQLALQDRFYNQQELHFFRNAKVKLTPTHAAHFNSLGKALRSADVQQAELSLEHIFDVQRHQHPPVSQVKDTALLRELVLRIPLISVMFSKNIRGFLPKNTRHRRSAGEALQ